MELPARIESSKVFRWIGYLKDVVFPLSNSELFSSDLAILCSDESRMRMRGASTHLENDSMTFTWNSC